MPAIHQPPNLFKSFVSLALFCCLAACAGAQRLNAVPDERYVDAEIPGMEDVRYLVDVEIDTFVADAYAADERYLSQPDIEPSDPSYLLAISGGGDFGAFGAGFMKGWTEAGDRPEFELVTGVSTGALMAPFVFLGPDYDDELRAVYTTISADDIFEPRPIFTLLTSDSAADTAPLRNLVERYVDENLMAAIGREHQRGRSLLVMTTNIDALRPVVWNITKIAASGHPDALELIHDALVASASIPAAFPPVYIDVEVDGEPYQEMHVDGGAIAQTFIYPPSLDVNQYRENRPARDVQLSDEVHLYILRNYPTEPEWEDVEPRLINISARAIDSFLQTQGIGDLYIIYQLTQRDGIDYNLATIPKGFQAEHETPFDTAFMNKLFDYGYEVAKDGYDWQKTPPGYRASAAEQPQASNQ